MMEVEILPDLPGIVHGIKSLKPCIIQCDGCGKTDTGEKVASTVVFSDICFNTRVLDNGDRRRLCAPCWMNAGWVEGDSTGWRQVGSKEVA